MKETNNKKIKFKSFSSGSCGNCYFLGLEEDGEISASVVIDAGVSLRSLKRELAREGLALESVHAVLVTHDHMDHIRSLGSFCKYLKKPVWATRTLHEALAHHSFTEKYILPCRREFAEGGWSEIVAGKIAVKAFEVPHDATQTVGFAIVIGGYTFVIMTDIGEMTKEALEFASKADTVVIESNYDVDMLMGGPYTYELKMRICKGHGHLSNDQCAAAIKKFWHDDLRNIFLCHLSEHNNTPELAHKCSEKALIELGVEAFPLRALPRQTASPLFIL